MIRSFLLAASVALCVAASAAAGTETVRWDSSLPYADRSAIHTGEAALYRAEGARRVVAVNAGHGTKGGMSVKTMCHPDGSPKVTGGTTERGATDAWAVSSGTKMNDGRPEADVTLALARLVRDRLLASGVSVLMLRDADDAQLDNVARSVLANAHADCHISLHFDGTENDKGLFYIGVPDDAAYRRMEPVASLWREHEAFGEAVLAAARDGGIKVHGSGRMAVDLTQTSYSTIPTVCVECGDRASDCSPEGLARIADSVAAGVIRFLEASGGL